MLPQLLLCEKPPLTATVVFRVLLRLLNRVTNCGGLEEPTALLPKSSVTGCIASGAAPVPERPTSTALALFAPKIVSAPEAGATVVGLKLTLIVQLAWAASDAPQ